MHDRWHGLIPGLRLGREWGGCRAKSCHTPRMRVPSAPRPINSITGFSGIQGHSVPASPRLCWGWRVEAPATAASRAMTTGRAITTECEATISRHAAPEGWRQRVFPEVKRAQEKTGCALRVGQFRCPIRAFAQFMLAVSQLNLSRSSRDSYQVGVGDRRRF
jgi:hypothetical protein